LAAPRWSIYEGIDLSISNLQQLKPTDYSCSGLWPHNFVVISAIISYICVRNCIIMLLSLCIDFSFQAGKLNEHCTDKADYCA
jgi:hypothetical protein